MVAMQRLEPAQQGEGTSGSSGPVPSRLRRATGGAAEPAQQLAADVDGANLSGSPACAPLRVRLTRRVEQAVTLFSLLQQLALYCHTAAGLSVKQHMHQAALVALRAACLALATYLPHRAWLKWR
jgi:hypothetical protein